MGHQALFLWGLLYKCSIELFNKSKLYYCFWGYRFMDGIGAVSLTNVSANAGLSIGSSETTPSSATLGDLSKGTNSITAGSISISGITSSFGSTTLNTQTALSLFFSDIYRAITNSEQPQHRSYEYNG